ncbi:AraC family transcriptional regulator ligand-binding domain-containing protein [Nocardia sp. NPDC059228]|uniref:AraC family transcriptional regulator n=1 Tax=Nocardia sp. NPDC059228 TaxID=3346777 RepID=UPI0036B8F699
MTTRTVPTHLVLGLLRAARRRQVDTGPLLGAAGVPRSAAEGHAHVTIDQMTALTRELVLRTEDDLYGLGEPVAPGTLELMSSILIHSRDLGDLLGRLDEATRVLPNLPRLCFHRGPAESVLRADLTAFDDPEHLAAELSLAYAHRLSGWMIRRRIPLRALELAYPSPAHALEYTTMFGSRPAFESSRTAITIDSDLLAVPLTRTEADLADLMNWLRGGMFATRDYGTTPADRVRALLEADLTSEPPTPAEIAARLHISTGYLRRLLQQQRTSVSAIRDEIMRDIAIGGLLHDEPLATLAERLGFSDVSAFRRAFRRWTGSTPSAYRAGRTAAGQ